MKKFTFLTILLLGFFLGITINGSGQTVIWSEDFSAYVSGTGIEGPGAVNIGDYPAGVTKWTLDVSGCTLSNSDDYIKTDYEKLKSQDLDGPAVWQSESIDLTAYSTGATFSIKFYEYSSMEPEDYIDVFYQLNGGDFVLIPNWNGHGSDIHTLIDDFSKDTVVQSVSACSNLVIKVTFNNDSGYEEFQMDDVFVYPNMEYVSSTTTQNTHKIAAGKTNRQIIGVEVVTTGTESPISITQFTINANGSSTPVSTNIENAKIYCTGTDNTFATDTQFGSTYASPTTTNFNITGTQQLSEGTNYFWLTFDTKTGATLGELIDAECISFIVEGSTENPTITAPAGSRTIAAPLSGNYTIGSKSNYASFTAAANDLNDLGISSPVSFSVASGTYTEQISLSAIDGTSATDTIIFQSSTNDPADVTLQFTQTSSANYVVKFDGTDYTSFLDMTIQSTGTSSYGKVFVFNGITQNIILKGNNIIGRDISLQDDDYIVIFAEGGTSNMAININIENDTIRYGSKGIYFEGGDASNLETGNTFINNVVEDFYWHGIETGYQDAVVINNNRLTGKNVSTTEEGIIAWNCYNDIEITQNSVLLSATDENIGITLSSCYGTTSLPGLIANNFVSITLANFGTCGIDIQLSGHQNIYHNSINAHSAKKGDNVSRSGILAGMGVTHYWTDPLFEGLKIISNIIVSGSLKGIEVSQTTADNGYLESSDNNDWYTSGATLGSWGSTNCADLTAWQAASGLDGSSVSTNPLFPNNTSYIVGEITLWESVDRVPEVLRGIGNMPRRLMTMPGANNSCHDWEGTLNDDWNNGNNWYPTNVPGSNDDIRLGPGASHQPRLPGNVTCRDLLGENGSTLNADGYNLTTTGNLHISESTITNDNQIILRGDGDTEFMPGTQRYNDLRINKDSDYHWVKVIYMKDTTVMRVDYLYVQKGKFQAQIIQVGRDADISGGTVDINEIEFTDAENASFTSGNNTLQSVVVDKSGSGQLTLQDALAASTLRVLDGNLNANNKNIEISGNTVDFLGGNFINSSDFTLTSDDAVLFNPGNNTFNNLSFTGGGTYDVLAKMIVEGDFLASGTVNANGNDFEFGRDVDLSNCNYNHGNGKFIVNGDEDQDIWTGMASFFFMQFNSITFNGQTTRIFTPNDAQVIIAEIIQIATSFLLRENSISDTVKFYGNVQCNNDFTIGTQDVGGVIVNIMPGYNLTVNGSTTINNSGTLVIKSNATGTFNQKITLY